MKLLLQLFILAAFIAVAALWCTVGDRLAEWWAARGKAAPRPAFDVDAMLDAIAAVESGNDPHAVGRAGERGRCQFTFSTWVRYTNAPFLLWAPVDCKLTRSIERAHLAQITICLFADGRQPEPALLAAAWRFGVLQAARNVRADSAQRAANLYFDRVGGAAE